jgi:tetratricopeptide (TPR) repeat protein
MFSKKDEARLFYTWAKYARMVLDEKLCERYSLEAYNYFSKEGDMLMAGAALQTLGGLEVQLGNLPKALDYTSKALRIKKGNSKAFAHFQKELGTIAIVYDMMGLYDKALLLYKEIIKFTENEDKPSWLGSLINVGVLYENLGQLDSAYYYFDMVEQDKSNDAAEMAYVAQFGKARIFNLRGRYKEADVLLQKVYAQTGDIFVLHYWRAKNHLDLGNLDSAWSIAKKAYADELHSTQASENLINLLDILSSVCEVRRKYDSALYFKKAQYALADSLFKKGTQRKLSSLYVEIETMDKQIEIDQLNAEKDINEVKNRDLTIIIVVGSFAAFMAIIAGIFIYRNRVKKHQLQTDRLRFEIEQKSRDLHHQALRMIQINHHLTEVEEQLRKLKKDGSNSPQEVQRLLTLINLNKNLEKEWENFSDYFSRVHEGFIETIENRFPNLSASEKRLVVLVRMNLTNKELASLLNIELGSVKMAKFRLKRKLNLSEDQDLSVFLENLQQETTSVPGGHRL